MLAERRSRCKEDRVGRYVKKRETCKSRIDEC